MTAQPIIALFLRRGRGVCCKWKPGFTGTHRRAQGHKHITELEVNKYYQLKGPNLHKYKGARVEEDINNMITKTRNCGWRPGNKFKIWICGEEN